jgi:hypothetical protein
MTGQFDPYHVWLGIPPAEQPPNHYRLLGLPLFESEANVIANGADRQMAHLKSFGTSKHANLAQRLLNECAAAKVCLLKPEKKAAYDSQLRGQLTAPAPPVPPASGAGAGAFPNVAPTVRRPPPVVARSRGKSQTGTWVAAAAGVLVVVGGLIGALIFANSKDNDQSGNQLVQSPNGAASSKANIPEKADDQPKTGSDNASERPEAITDAAKNGGETKSPNGNSSPTENIEAVTTKTDTKSNVSSAIKSPPAQKFPVVWLPEQGAKPFDGMTQIAGWPSGVALNGSVELNSPEAARFRPGLILLRYPRQAIQKQEPGAFVLPKDLGSPLGAPLVARGMARLHFPWTENVVAVGYLRITEAGQYTIGGGNRFGRDTVYLSGEPIVKYSNRAGTRYNRKTLDPGYYPIAIAGYADSDGHAGINVTRRAATSGRQGTRLGEAVFFHDPSLAANATPNLYMPAPVAAAQREVVAQIQESRDVVSGRWEKSGGQLRATAGADEQARVQIPVEVPAEYDLSFRALRTGGDGPLVVGLVYKGRVVALSIDGWRENAIGFLQYNGTKGDGSVAFAEPCLRLGQTSQLTFSVREWGIQAQIDGYVVFRHPLSRDNYFVGGNWAWTVPNLSRPFVGMQRAGFSLESLVIQPVGQPVVTAGPTTIASTNPVTTPNESPQQGNARSFETRKAAPDEEKQKEVEKQVREVFAKDFAAVKKPADRAALAATLLRHAQETKDDPDATYMLLLLAKNTAAEAGEATLALRAVDQIVEDYEVESTAERIAALTRLAATAHQAAQVKMVIDTAGELGQDLIAQDKYEEAVKAFTAARNMAGKAKEPELAKGLTQRIKDIAPLENQYKTVREALKKLEGNEDDADANVVVGRWHWFAKNRPDKAMPYFSKAADAELKAAAGLELDNPSDAKGQLAVADAWDQLSVKRRGPDKQPFELRAFHWYLRASASAQGLDKAKADKRVEEIRAAIEKRLLADAGKAGTLPLEMKSLLAPGVVVEYFSDQQLGSRALMKVVENVRTNPLHRNEAKMPPTGQFSARWTGWLIPPKAGTYKIVFNYRAGLYIDNKPVVAPRQTKTDVVVELSARPHHIRYEAGNLGWGSVPRFEWQHEEEGASRPITPEFLFHVPLPGEAPAELPVVRPRL